MSTASARSQPPPPAPLRRTPTAEQWRQMTEPERDRFFGEVFDALNAAAEALPEGRPHRRAKSSALDALILHFKTTGRQIYVVDELTVMYPEEFPFAPDLLAVLDVPQPDPDKDERMAWVVAQEGRGPDFVLEVLHQGNRDKDLIHNVTNYARLGIREYFIYDRLRFKLYGYRQPSRGARYQELRPRLGRLTSEVLGLDLALLDQRLRFFSGMGELLNSEEFIARLETMMEGIEARAQQAEARADQAQQERQQAQQERQQAQQESLLAARDAIFDLAEAYGLEVPPERKQQVTSAGAEELVALRRTLKATRAWPSS